MFIRIIKRKSAWELNNPLEVIKIEFVNSNGSGFDLKPSVYKIDSTDNDTKRSSALRAHTEHIVSFLQPKGPSKLASIDTYFSDLPLPEPTMSKSLFQYTQNSHHEYEFSDDGQLCNFVERLINNKDERILEFTRSDVELYIKQKVEIEQNEEWISLSSSNSQVYLWTKRYIRN
ncbi:MAG: hypothetical protein Q7T53_11225 [Deltaproteobacteria bacterium]|nr:hypothetical protein [Deltaproteobacteria bacterium]